FAPGEADPMKCKSLLAAALLCLSMATAAAAPPPAQPTVQAPPEVAEREPSLDERIDAVVRPVADTVSRAIFSSVRVGGPDEAPVRFPLIVAWLILGGLVTTFYFRFINIRGFRHGLDLIRGKYADPNSAGEVSHFQALTSAVSGTVGLGNIAGVAVAITIGGPGATFWMILAGLLGMSTK